MGAARPPAWEHQALGLSFLVQLRPRTRARASSDLRPAGGRTHLTLGGGWRGAAGLSDASTRSWPTGPTSPSGRTASQPAARRGETNHTRMRKQHRITADTNEPVPSALLRTAKQTSDIELWWRRGDGRPRTLETRAGPTARETLQEARRPGQRFRPKAAQPRERAGVSAGVSTGVSARTGQVCADPAHTDGRCGRPAPLGFFFLFFCI